MTAYDADEAVRNARTYQEYARGYCLRWVRDACWELPGLYASAIEAWNGARHKHPDDRNPPKGAPCYYRGGRYGHIVITTTHDRIRSTDCLTAHDVSEVDVDWCERAWGYTYLGWSEDLNGVQLALTEEEEEDMPLNQEDKDWISNEIRKQVEESWRKVQDNDNSRGKNLNIAGKAGNVILNAGTVIVASWNCHVNRPATDVQAGLAALIKDVQPDVICLQEAYQFTDMIRDRFEGYRLYAKQGWTQSNNCPVMIEANRDKKKYGDTWGTLRCYTRWTGPEGVNHPGRTWTWVKAGGIYIVSLHRCLGGHGPNKDAYKEEFHVLHQFTQDADGPVLIFGDTNTTHTADHPGSMKNLADRVKGELRYDRKQPGIDYGLQRGIKGTVKRTKEYGSDHKAAIWTERTTTTKEHT